MLAVVLKRFTLGRSFGSQLALSSAILMAPLILLSALFVRESWRDIAFVQRELQGVGYLSAIWPEFNAAAGGAPEPRASGHAFDREARALDPSLGTANETARFTAARTPAAKAETGESLIRKVADRSNLTLDTELDTYYLMEATTVHLPAMTRAAAELLQASQAAGAPLERGARLAVARDRVESSQAAVEAAVEAALDQVPGRTAVEARKDLAGHISALKAAAEALTPATIADGGASPRAPEIAAVQRLQREIDATWHASTAELTRLLEARRARLTTRLGVSLAFILLAVAASVAIVRAIARGLAVRVRDLNAAMMRLTAGELAIDVPWRSDPSELGRIAEGVEAFKNASADRARLTSELERANETLREYQSWLRLAMTAGRMGAWRRKLPEMRADFSPELSDLLGLPGGTELTVGDIAALSLDQELVQRWVDEADRAAAGELDELATEETIAPFRRFDNGAIRWAMLRRELITDPVRGGRDIVGVAIDITERKHLMDELNHRVKNNLATVLSLAMQTAKSTEDLKGFMKAFTGRIQALSKINELVTRHGWGQVSLKEVLTTMLRPWLDSGVTFVPSAPENTAVSSRAAVSLSLVLHEMAANAVLHGALGADKGCVEISWSQPDPKHVALTWAERTRLTDARAAGFSAPLIQRLIAGDLGGKADIEDRPEGLSATITFALQGATA